jgi:hypothetical protein
MPAATPDDYDTPWKTALTRYFPEFLLYYFPDIHAALDWSDPLTFLGAELAQLSNDSLSGHCLADQLVSTKTLGGGTAQLHIEVQAYRDRFLTERIFRYNYRIHDRYRLPLASLVVLADSAALWRPEQHSVGAFGCHTTCRFRTVKLLDFASAGQRLCSDANPFALVTAAHLLTQRTRKQPRARAAAKWRLAQALYTRNWDRQRVFDLYSIIDSLMRLPADLEAKVWRWIHELERSKTMPYVTFAERYGREIGLKEGREEGREEGRQEGLREMLERMLVRRFGPLPDAARMSLQGAQTAQLLAWAEAVMDARSMEEVFAR